MVSEASDNARATRSRNRARKEGRNVTTGDTTGTDQVSTSLEGYMSNNVQATLSNTKTNGIPQSNISASSGSTTSLYRPTRSGRSPRVSTAPVSEAEAGPSLTQVGKRRATDTSEDPSSKKRRASRLGNVSLSRRQSPPPSPESLDE